MIGFSQVSASLLIVSIALTVFLTLPRFYRRHQRSVENNQLYRDKDGTSTKATQFAFDRERKVHMIVLCLVNIVGIIVNLAAVFLSAAPPTTELHLQSLLTCALRASAATLVAIQGIIVAFDRSPKDRYHYGIVASVCSTLVYGVNIGYDLQNDLSPESRLPFLVAHSALLVISLLVYLTIPRRPRVFRDGNAKEQIDEEQAASVLSKYTLSWANPLLWHASRKGGLDMQDLPRLSESFLTGARVYRFHHFKRSRLWRQVLLTHRSAFIAQWIITLFCSLATFAPQFILYRLIMSLENSATAIDPQANLWLSLLALFQLLQPWLETWVLWIGWCHISLPIEVQLSGLIVEKSLRRKNVKSAASETNSSNSESTLLQDKAETKEDNVDMTTSKAQEASNLITVDTQRISQFLSYNSMLMGLTLNILISFSFLLSLIRIQSILIAFACVSFLIPLHILGKRRFDIAQNGLMDARDQKAATISEAIEGIRQIKFDALEHSWGLLLQKVRTTELSWQWKAYIAEALLMTVWVSGPYLFAAVALASVSLNEKGLSPAVAFTALAIFQRLEGFLSLVTTIITDLSSAWISFGRVEDYLLSSERIDNTIENDTVEFRHAFVAWPSHENMPRQAQLHDIEITFPNKALSIITGPTGSGKSLLLSSIIGEADILGGTIRRPRSDFASSLPRFQSSQRWIIPQKTAFVAQTAWIENATIQNNILFGLPLVQDRYAQILESCALSHDMEIIEDGDQTEIGARGISLSGGQRSRISLARALYSQAEILLIDDVFSAVDIHVARHILGNALTGKLVKERTVILVTHNVSLCRPKADFEVILNEGKIAYTGAPSNLAQDQLSPLAKDRANSKLADLKPAHQSEPLTTAKKRQKAQVSDTAVDSKPRKSSRKLVQQEGRNTGRMKFDVYKRYLAAASEWPWLYWTALITVLVGSEMCLIARNWWIKVWTEETSSDDPNLHSWTSIERLSPLPSAQQTMQQSYSASKNWHYIAGYISISVLLALLGAGKFLWAYVGSLHASRSLSNQMTDAVLHAPLRWLDTVPSGRILNRFIADFNVLDINLANHLVMLIWSGLQLLGIIVVGTLVSPFLLLFSIPLVIMSLLYARHYLAGARDVKRLQSITNSPILDQLESILSGLDTIRAWDKSTLYIHSMYVRIDDHARCTWHLWLFNRWLGIRFAVIGAIFTSAVAALSVYSKSVSASLAGLVLTFSLEFSYSIFWVLRRYADVEMDMNSLERVIDYCTIQTEPSGGMVPPAHWPSQGRVDISGLVVGYVQDAPPVLREVTFSCEPCTRVGIVGRTGAGKSSLTLALLRFLEARAGSISIDGLDIATLPLKDLRERIGIIPQQPNLWLGTIRSNLDHFHEYDDVTLQQALGNVGLSQQLMSLDTADGDNGSLVTTAIKLSTPIAKGGLNISLGQRQLVCLARALLSRPKILLLDEATSAVDTDTDRAVQQTIRSKFNDSTLIVIAHKLSTIIDFDQIVVLEEGRVVEIGNPEKLMKQGTHFRKMIQQSGDQALLDKIKGPE